MASNKLKGTVEYRGKQIPVEVEIGKDFLGCDSVIIHFEKGTDTKDWINMVSVRADMEVVL